MRKVEFSSITNHSFAQTKTPHRFLDEEFILNIEFYFNISPASYTLCWGYGIDIFLCILNRQSEFSELSENYCVSNKVPGYPFQIFDLVNGWGSYFLPSAIAACEAVSKVGKLVKTNALAFLSKILLL